MYRDELPMHNNTLSSSHCTAMTTKHGSDIHHHHVPGSNEMREEQRHLIANRIFFFFFGLFGKRAVNLQDDEDKEEEDIKKTMNTKPQLQSNFAFAVAFVICSGFFFFTSAKG